MLIMDFIIDVSQIVLADIVLSGDNALIIGMAAASFAEKDRKKIIFFGVSLYFLQNWSEWYITLLSIKDKKPLSF